jgi:hypothetical protein
MYLIMNQMNRVNRLRLLFDIKPLHLINPFLFIKPLQKRPIVAARRPDSFIFQTTHSQYIQVFPVMSSKLKHTKPNTEKPLKSIPCDAAHSRERARFRKNDIDRKRRARNKIIAAKRFRCLGCKQPTDIEGARVCTQCTSHPYRHCFQCDRDLKRAHTVAYIAETEDLQLGYDESRLHQIAHTYSRGLDKSGDDNTGNKDPVLPSATCAAPRAYYHYTEDAWSDDRRRVRDYSVWASSYNTLYPAERIRILPSCSKCAIRLPNLRFWPRREARVGERCYQTVSARSELELH